ncbi:hypothetical protein J1770_gp24 [Gordonia phage EMoore]|uniref:Uncharacterized protein n=1 Tax=Gordonia phage EMoore TaxID=2656534 RepID=A0A649VTA4_9CAUD|nr:hypothetical protein J1770_gp24 [Gordonia phage EMoore]QGJ95810.1 hypothetical protein SEA_EMOORE_24 [Gordonia phage EMoore]
MALFVLERAQVEVAKTRAGGVDRVFVSPDRPAGEFCGQLWATVTSIVPKPARDKRAATVKACAHEWRVSLTLGVYRCDPTYDQRNARPMDAVKPVALDSAARDLLDDAEALRRAILDAAWDDIDIDREQVQLGAMRMTQRSGGSFGVEWDLMVDTELGRMTDEAATMLSGDPRK